MKFNQNSMNNFRYETSVDRVRHKCPLSVISENIALWSGGGEKPLSQPNKTKVYNSFLSAMQEKLFSSMSYSKG
jgi:hypothetical protein